MSKIHHNIFLCLDEIDIILRYDKKKWNHILVHWVELQGKYVFQQYITRKSEGFHWTSKSAKVQHEVGLNALVMSFHFLIVLS